MSSHRLVVAFDARAPARLAGFWAALLSREVVAEAGSALLPGDDSRPGLRFVGSDRDKLGPNPVHLHLTSVSPADQEQTVATALRLGASHLDVGQLPEEGHVVLADPEGNELCVIGPDSAFLAGCGFLGEVACDGTREVGHFWSEALGWPLVWDQDEETAVQSPQGGTKVAWGGPPVAPRGPGRRQQFEVVSTEAELGPEVERLLALGATLVQAGDDVVTLADPDGSEFTVSSRGARVPREEGPAAGPGARATPAGPATYPKLS